MIIYTKILKDGAANVCRGF